MNADAQINPEDLEVFPNLGDYKKELKTLDNYDFTGKSESEIYNIFYDYAKLFPSRISWFKPENFNSHRFYRVRLNINLKDEDITLAQTYSYPPPKFCFENGRANKKGRSVFYCSNQPYAAILECKPKVGDAGFLSVWKGVAKRNIKIGNLLSPDLPLENDWLEMAVLSFQAFKKSMSLDARGIDKHLVMLQRFVAFKFIKEKSPYSLTSMLSEELLYGQLWHDLIVYPSVASNIRFCNMAFHPNSVDENLKFEKLIRFKVVGYEDDEPVFQLCEDVGFIDNIRMVWKKRTDEETKIFGNEIK
ncbi:MAG TPA: hypothetical protein ENH87_22345 [Pricia antarctica]|uniref:RES domain-containing protein n=2 Tax=root TaxID=1 RepID=A0A831QVC1_9FLAO|nr:hypothetical protein [Pricia antarctica]